jgi:hypothetical protein
MRLSLLFLLAIIFIPTLVSSQNEVSNPEKVKIPKEIGVNFGRYIRGEYGFNGFFKIRHRQQNTSKKNWEKQVNFRFSGGYFVENSKNKASFNFLGDERYDSTFNQKDTHAYFLFGLEKSFKKEKHSYWYGVEIGPYNKNFTDNNFTRNTRVIAGASSTIEYTSITRGRSVGGILDLNFGYKYAFTSKLNLGVELNIWTRGVYTQKYYSDSKGLTHKFQLSELDRKLYLFPSSLFLSYTF